MDAGKSIGRPKNGCTRDVNEAVVLTPQGVWILRGHETELISYREETIQPSPLLQSNAGLGKPTTPTRGIT